MQKISLLSDIFGGYFVLKSKNTVPRYAYSVKNNLMRMLCSLLSSFFYFNFSLKNVVE